MIYKILLLALVGGLIGWFTNVIAIKLLFRPLEPIKMPVLNIRIQGLIPMRKEEIAKSIGETVENELISMEEIMDEMIENTDKKDLINVIKVKIVAIAQEKMPSMVPSSFKGMIINYIEETIDSEGETIFNELSEQLIHRATDKINIATFIEDKVNLLEMEKLEAIILDIARKELKHIEMLGGLIGVIIGLVQGVLILGLS